MNSTHLERYRKPISLIDTRDKALEIINQAADKSQIETQFVTKKVIVHGDYRELKLFNLPKEKGRSDRYKILMGIANTVFVHLRYGREISESAIIDTLNAAKEGEFKDSEVNLRQYFIFINSDYTEKRLVKFNFRQKRNIIRILERQFPQTQNMFMEIARCFDQEESLSDENFSNMQEFFKAHIDRYMGKNPIELSRKKFDASSSLFLLKLIEYLERHEISRVDNMPVSIPSLIYLYTNTDYEEFH